eukprot:CAMPEP_0202693124 /NCGR_PEP_ID=MMETSP1385-20130828/7329_1 /ASSEMBLY_ACC=CAM_ASM_000861 /TAXON_ID=933848 /ORGANISM="Elphidium margaritaceum" /LENGTH=587 /DNA_ID=CAMNT_0049348765 /DNA_START=19 /DNA_END=1782 /DNA_ORIENTATION=-
MTDLSIKIINSSAIRDRGKRAYTIYEIEVRSNTTTTIPWTLFKRYSEFDNLHMQLQKIISGDKDLEALKLTLPPKTFTRSMAADVVAKRQKDLEAYLQQIVVIPVLMRSKVMWDFLNVPESLRFVLRNRPSGTRPNPGLQINGIDSSAAYSHIDQNQSEEEREVSMLLKGLSQKTRVKALHKFENWYFEKTTSKSAPPPNMSRELIRKLYTGDEVHQGLVHSCRMLQSKVAWRTSIALLVHLLDIERNKYARVFTEVFLSLQQGLYKEMYLQQHIKESTHDDGFKIVQLIKNRRPELDRKMYVPDDDAWKRYEKWEKLQEDSFGVIGGGHNKRRNAWFEDAANINDNMEQAFAYNWAELEYKEVSENIFSLFRELSMDEKDYQKVNAIKNDCGLKVRYKKDPFTKQWKLKITFAVDHPPEHVYNFLSTQMIYVNWTANQSDMSWNTKIIQQQQVEKLDHMHYIVHQTYKAFNSSYRYTDFLLFTCLRADSKAKRYHILFASVNNYHVLPHIQLMNLPNSKRSILLPSGFEIRPAKDNVNKSHVSFRAHYTNESVLTVSADLLGETDELFHSVLRIEQLISAEMVHIK